MPITAAIGATAASQHFAHLAKMLPTSMRNEKSTKQSPGFQLNKSPIHSLPDNGWPPLTCSSCADRCYQRPPGFLPAKRVWSLPAFRRYRGSLDRGGDAMPDRVRPERGIANCTLPEIEPTTRVPPPLLAGNSPGEPLNDWAAQALMFIVQPD